MKNLIIIGAGGHGRVIKEIAHATGQFEKIDFVDDKKENAIGKISDLEKLVCDYSYAIVSIGNNDVRNELINKSKNLGYIIPTLIHPTAYVSESSSIGIGSVIEPHSVIHTNAKVGEGCIISVGAIIDHDATLGDYCHINAGAIVKSRSVVNNKTKIDSGEVFG